MRNFKKKSEHYLKNALFFVQIFFSVYFSNQRKTFFKMAKMATNHMTFFWDFWSKLFGNILKIFLISCSKLFELIFLKSPAKNMANATFYFFQICLRFVSSLLFILRIIIFETKLRFGRNPSKPFFIRN
jgi:hypothetical protein